MRRPIGRSEWIGIAAITAGAAALRLIGISKVSPDPFYDAAVRSMGLSFHNFFFGAFEPGASVSIDKPPVDLWLQVVSVKALGFSSTTLKLPEVLAGIASAPLLWACVRRLWGTPAALASALTIAVLPAEVITARSDTMDAVMMALLVLSLLLLVRACETDSLRWLLASAATLGIAFDVKLLESVIALPALLLIAYMGLPARRSRRLLQLAGAAAVYVAVALSWLTATLIVPGHKPWAVGSSNGSAWNAAFVFNGTERLAGKSQEPNFSVYEPSRHYPEETQAERDRIPIVPPSATRLLARIGPLSGLRLGLVLLASLLLGVPALALSSLARSRLTTAGAHGERDQTGPGEDRVRRAVAAGIAVWVLTGIVLFSAQARLHPRYVEAFVPAVAALLGIGAAWAASPEGRARVAVLCGALVLIVAYGERLLYGTPLAWWVTVLAALAAIACAALARLHGISERARIALAPAGALTLCLLAVLAIPLSADVTAIRTHVSYAGYVGALPREEQRLVSAYLRAHQDGARYEVAAESATGIGSLVVQDARPIVVLTSYNARVFTNVAALQQLVAEGKVRYAFLNSTCSRRGAAQNPACSQPARWVRAHATDVSREAGLRRGGVLWLLPGARP